MTQMSIDPSPSNVKIQKERPVCMSLTLEGHGDHYVKRAMQWCRDPSPSNVKMQKERPVCMSFIIEGHGDHYAIRDQSSEHLRHGNNCSALQVTLHRITSVRNHGQLCVVLLSGVVSLMAALTTGVLMSPGYGGYQATAAKEHYTTSPPHYKTMLTYLLHRGPQYTTEASEYYTKTYAAPSYWEEKERHTHPQKLHPAKGKGSPPFLHIRSKLWRRAAVVC
ncbi:LOW QUALITY PROTEIN: hypothetical protein DAPPUDRAFT_274845 [Daphnia pulex]|uniref:Uncharacterized protein n=1 Tax=Daphnia pulex TaxID=6669 RepID=E9I4T6_DAPPU|nr:LOW QUALITY PROTEIN: hypothetical protein DAPPUDRAFT_274845 [Daphnia pulex]|eukprot:EFX60994.1 LOW QUALITY PROTEIN: hypothetical protein DAPPUDRAFT_274845 [Daphnia pulex]